MTSTTASRRARKLEGRLLLERGVPVLMLDGGGRWRLELDHCERWLGQRVRIEGMRSGFDRIDVAVIAGPGESLEQARLVARRRERRLVVEFALLALIAGAAVATALAPNVLRLGQSSSDRR